ncbi:3-hydroxybutyryl-CoA dehydrogenase [Haloplasma contractile]|uniref:3-hydroxybutyryl-CoA dehydrogenase protein n=1 Tax=Haloplasma contractile SSD-17B TaxID=1033810 RepID=F7Q0J4_9MOLU|nr:3-hydroxybutyryl-CoA dehydrogenase [Haloplasma contractile]ERJ12661.1 3-hydroxybutyryl-CoA dehydrogenase protein [Haloplasma contractile SSD-17B]
MKVLVIGSGTMGTGIAQVLLQGNNQVVLYDINQDALTKGMERISKSLSKLISKNKINEEQKASYLQSLSITTRVEECRDVALVIEAATEHMPIKKEIFKMLDGVIQNTAILATNTSSLSITEIAAVTSRPDKVIGVHFFNPAPVMKLVELIKGLATSDETFTIVNEFITSINKKPILVEEAPGFVVNRLLIPMINEAIGIYAEGIASAENIDQAMKLGANHPLGPLELADLIGNDVNLAIMETLHKEFGDPKYRPHPYLKKMVRAGKFGKKSGEGFYIY